MLGSIRRLFAHPSTRELALDDPKTTELRAQIIRDKAFLRRIYAEWYGMIAASLPVSHPIGELPVLELGSGGGFMREVIPALITSEVFPCANVDRVVDAHELPFADRSLRAIVMTDVLHHIPRVRDFFRSAARCVASGGAISMIEPWVSTWSRAIYGHLHHEPFHPDAASWELSSQSTGPSQSTGGPFPHARPLSGANGALPWILFHRDRAQFEREFPEWRIRSIQPFMPFRYLASGGVSVRGSMPDWTFELWRRGEMRLERWMDRFAMFAHIVVDRT